MSASNIFLILISGLGVLHGVFLAIFLQIQAKYNTTSNKFLSLLLLVLSFRVGKSVFLEFAEDLELYLIFIGLASLLAVGPLFYFYTKSLLDPNFKFTGKYLTHFIPAFLGVLFGTWINQELIISIPKVIFAILFLTYYGHYLLYLLICYRFISKERKSGLDADSYSLLQLLFYSLLAVWFVYVLNLFDDLIPYVIGPILYTVLAYTVSLIVIRKGYLKPVKYKTTIVSEEQIDKIWTKVQQLVVEEKHYKNGDLTLKSLSKQLNVTPQVLSMVINKKYKTNFNGFINKYRIEESIRMFENEKYKHLTIASISFEAGFNSISSFNTAFKNHTKSTPKAFRKRLSE